MILENLSQYLQNNGIGTQGIDIFRREMPAGVDNCIMLDEAGGLEPDKDLPLSDPIIDVRVRNKDGDLGKSKIDSIKNLLHQKLSLTLESGGVDVMICNCVTEPFHLGTDDNERHLFTASFHFKLR